MYGNGKYTHCFWLLGGPEYSRTTSDEWKQFETTFSRPKDESMAFVRREIRDGERTKENRTKCIDIKIATERPMECFAYEFYTIL